MFDSPPPPDFPRPKLKTAITTGWSWPRFVPTRRQSERFRPVAHNAASSSISDDAPRLPLSQFNASHTPHLRGSDGSSSAPQSTCSSNCDGNARLMDMKAAQANIIRPSLNMHHDSEYATRECRESSMSADSAINADVGTVESLAVVHGHRPIAEAISPSSTYSTSRHRKNPSEKHLGFSNHPDLISMSQPHVSEKEDDDEERTMSPKTDDSISVRNEGLPRGNAHLRRVDTDDDYADSIHICNQEIAVNSNNEHGDGAFVPQPNEVKEISIKNDTLSFGTKDMKRSTGHLIEEQDESAIEKDLNACEEDGGLAKVGVSRQSDQVDFLPIPGKDLVEGQRKEDVDHAKREIEARDIVDREAVRELIRGSISQEEGVAKTGADQTIDSLSSGDESISPISSGDHRSETPPAADCQSLGGKRRPLVESKEPILIAHEDHLQYSLEKADRLQTYLNLQAPKIVIHKASEASEHNMCWTSNGARHPVDSNRVQSHVNGVNVLSEQESFDNLREPSMMPPEESHLYDTAAKTSAARVRKSRLMLRRTRNVVARRVILKACLGRQIAGPTKEALRRRACGQNV